VRNNPFSHLRIYACKIMGFPMFFAKFVS